MAGRYVLEHFVSNRVAYLFTIDAGRGFVAEYTQDGELTQQLVLDGGFAVRTLVIPPLSI